METSFDPIRPKTLCSLSPTPVMLHIKFDQDWPTGLRDIQVCKCGWRRTTTTDGRTDEGPLVYYKLTLWAFGSGELKIQSLSTLEAISLYVLSEHVQHPWALFWQITLNFASRERSRLIARNPWQTLLKDVEDERVQNDSRSQGIFQLLFRRTKFLFFKLLFM